MAEYYGLNPNLAGAGASAHTYTLEDYPLSLDKKRSLPDWLDSLTRVTLQNTPNYHDRGCTCCNYPNNHQPFTDYALESLERQENWLLKLPCGCSYRRGCVVDMLKERDSCLYCGFEFFKQWTLRGYVKGLPSADPVKEKERGRDAECGICQREFGDQHVHPEEQPGFTLERPIKLPCSHMYGEDCLRQWLSPASKGGGNANTCPSCREVLFPPWPADHRDALAEVGLDDDDDVSDSSSISSWDDSTVLGEGDDATSRPATHRMPPPMPAVQEEEEEDVAPVHVETRTSRPYAMRGEDMASTHAAIPTQVETRTSRPYSMRGEQIAQSHASTRTRRPRNSTASDEEDIAPPPAANRTRRPQNSTASGGERPLPESVRRVFGNSYVRNRVQTATSDAERRTTRPQVVAESDDEEDSEDEGEEKTSTFCGSSSFERMFSGLRIKIPLRELTPQEQRNRRAWCDEKVYWGAFINMYSYAQHHNASQREEADLWINRFITRMGKEWDVYCSDETPEERTERFDIIKEMLYEDLGKPNRRRMARLNANMQDYEDNFRRLTVRV